MNGSELVLAAAGGFVATHFILSHPLRAPLVGAMGERGFLGLYSLVAFATLGATVWAYRRAPATEPFWPVGDGLWGVATGTMLIASVLLLGSLIRNPALPGAAGGAGAAEARGVYAVTRHPMMWAFAIWGRVAHPGLSDPQERGAVRRDHRPRAGRCGVAGPKEACPRSAGLGGVAGADQLLAVRRDRRRASEARRVRRARARWGRGAVADGGPGRIFRCPAGRRGCGAGSREGPTWRTQICPSDASSPEGQGRVAER